MIRLEASALVMACLLAGGSAAAQTAAQTAAQARVIAGDPPYASQTLSLAGLPAPSGPSVQLFNGRDLAEWEPWLGYRDPGKTYASPPEAPLGPVGVGDVFRVVEVDGRPALYVSGKTWGSLVHTGDFANYHLRLQYRWGPGRWPPRENQPPNNGLLYHTHGAPGSVFGTWSPSVEFEIMERSTGMAVRVGEHVRPWTFAGRDTALRYPMRRFMLGGREVEIVSPAWNVEAARDAERPAGEWDTLDLYDVGASAIHVVNGVPVMALHGIATVDGAGRRTPLTHGRIQLQSEGAETYFRDIVLTPIDRLPEQGAVIA
jgi:hypothetical protein